MFVVLIDSCLSPERARVETSEAGCRPRVWYVTASQHGFKHASLLRRYASLVVQRCCWCCRISCGSPVSWMRTTQQRYKAAYTHCSPTSFLDITWRFSPEICKHDALMLQLCMCAAVMTERISSVICGASA